VLGLAVSVDRVPDAKTPHWFSVMAEGKPRPPGKQRAPRVVDLSSLWAGPLCSHLLQRLGAEVIKVESPSRPDGARQGHPAFFDLLNTGKRCVAIDPRQESGREQLRALIASADIVIEGSRPRGLRQLGIDAEQLVRDSSGLSWIAISGHGRGEPQENWVAYGDDAAVAAGLSQLMFQATGQHLICGDAIADPLTGLHAALVAWASYSSGGGRLLSLALSGVVAHCIAFDLPGTEAALRERQQQWTALAYRSGVCPPRARSVTVAAQALGADTDAVLGGLGIPC
jgi:crotonobetainyl-CoA:carnitine CoA-transferase CaiB-like acyl-CoA transferase